jgi:hypothetical protein
MKHTSIVDIQWWIIDDDDDDDDDDDEGGLEMETNLIDQGSLFKGFNSGYELRSAVYY